MNLIKLLFKNAFRHKLRTYLTILGMTIAILAFGLLRTVVGAWYAGVEASSANRLVTRNAISLVFTLPISYKDKIRQVEGVKEVTWGNWFGGYYIEEKNFFANFCMDLKTDLDVYPEIIVDPDQKAALLRDRKGALVGRKLADRFGWKIGDAITLKGTIYPGNWEMVVRAIYKGRDKSIDESQLIFHWDYLNETLKKTVPRRADQSGFFVIGISNPNQAADVSVSVDKLFKNSLAETLTETEKAFQMGFVSMSEAIVIAIQLVSFVIIIIIMAVVANTMAMAARERTGEYAILKALGFGGWYIAALIFGESLVITGIGCALGIAATFPAAKAFGDAMGAFFPIFNVAGETIYMDISAFIIVGVVAAIVPTVRTVNIRIADGLRKIG